jgi:hypothetical protein
MLASILLASTITIPGLSMQHTEFEPELAYALRHAANFYRMSTAKYIRVKLQQAIDELAEANPLYREIIETKP